MNGGYTSIEQSRWFLTDQTVGFLREEITGLSIEIHWRYRHIPELIEEKKELEILIEWITTRGSSMSYTAE